MSISSGPVEVQVLLSDELHTVPGRHDLPGWMQQMRGSARHNGAMLAAVLLALAPSVQESVPLLVVPEGWQGERLEFPLDFAPELEFRGVEELAFAPGMFDKSSESYFSYALAIELEGDVAIDAAFLEHFLATYYRGLCRAVGASRQLTLDLEAVTASVDGGGDHFRATVKTFDPFTDGGALELALELRTWPRAATTQLFGIASPRPRDAAIWKELTALHQGWMRPRPAPFVLNHVSWVVDPATYEALRAEPFLRELGVVEERTVERPDRSYTLLALHGQRTHIEFVRADPEAGLAAGRSELAFGVERAGASEALAIEMHRKGHPSRMLPVKRSSEGPAVPWFTLLALEMPAGPLEVVSQEYATRFLTQWNPGLAPRTGGIGRSAVLERYAAAAGQDRARAALGDLGLVELRLDAAQVERLTGIATAAGFVATTDEPARLQGPGLSLLLARQEAAGGVVRCEFGLRRALEHAPLELGRLRLYIEGSRAILELAP